MSRVTRRARELRRRFHFELPDLLPSRSFRGWRPHRPRIPLAFKLALVALAVLFVAYGATTYLDRLRRTAEAPAEIVRLDSFHSPGKGAAGGINIRYRFVAMDGRRYESSAFRGWDLDTIHRAKVCYDPAEPINNALVTAEDSCTA